MINLTAILVTIILTVIQTGLCFALYKLILSLIRKTIYLTTTEILDKLNLDKLEY